MNYFLNLRSTTVLISFLSVNLIAPYAISQDVAKQKTMMSPVKMDDSHRAVLKEYCYQCHDSDTAEGNVDLESLSLSMDSMQNAERWNAVLRVINAGEMPPAEADPIAHHTKESFLSVLSRKIVEARKQLSDVGGRNTIRRLNRREYQNTIEDLFGVVVDVSGLPDDVGGSGFDTSGSALFFSSDQLETYLSVGRAAIDECFDARWDLELNEPIRLEGEDFLTPYFKKKARGRRDQIARAEQFNQQADKSDDSARAFGFRDAARAASEEVNSRRSLPVYEAYLAHPLSTSGGLLGIFDRELRIMPITLRENIPFGDYKVRVRVAALQGDGIEDRFHGLEFVRTDMRAHDNFEVLDCRHITGVPGSPQTVEFQLRIDGQSGRYFAVRARQHNTRAAIRPTLDHFIDVQSKASKPWDQPDADPALAEFQKMARSRPDTACVPFLWVDWVEVEKQSTNSVNPARQKFSYTADSTPQNTENARRVLRDFARVVYRGNEISDSFLDRLTNIVGQQQQTSSFDEALRTAMSVILTSPKFLYLAEPASEDVPRSLSAVELANRLSYFLWSGPPDEELLTLAQSGQLLDRDVLKAQTIRLLNDDRMYRFVSSFAYQWLDMKRLHFFQFDLRDHPNFDESLRAAAGLEITETIVSLIREGGSARTLLDSDYVIINDILANQYEIEGVSSHRFQRVLVPDGNPQGGLLATVAIAAMGSDGVHSSPVERGVWVLRHLLHDPPPPAPANVPQLQREQSPHLPIRALQSAHQKEAQCAQCHRDIDPIGYGMHNFSADGRWRDQETTKEKDEKNNVVSKQSHPIDASGTMPDGTAFENFFEMRNQIAKHDAQFSRGFAEALIEYGLGRPYGFTDDDLANDMLVQAKAEDYRMDVFIHALIQSETFRTKK